jgi:hypothetical protein
MPRHRMLVALLAASFFVVGLVEPFTSRAGDLHSPLSLLHMVVIAVLLYLWCKAEAASRGVFPPKGVAILVAVLPPLGIPVYLFMSRSWRAALAGIAVALVCLLALMIAGAVGLLIADQWLAARAGTASVSG